MCTRVAQKTTFGDARTLNYLEGQASIRDQTLDSKSVGPTSCKTGKSRRQCAMKMITPSLSKTTIALNQGKAMLESTSCRAKIQKWIEVGATQVERVSSRRYSVPTTKLRSFAEL